MKKLIKITRRTKTIFKRATALLLFITMLPFSSFAGVGVREVNAAAVSANSIISPEIESNILPENLPEEMTEKIHTHGGEDIDTFVNKILQGEFPEETENVIIEGNDTLTEDLVVMDLTLKKGTFDLRGNTLYICGNFIHSGGVLKINGGRVVVLGDYRIQSPVQKTENEETEEQDEYTTSEGCLQMINENDYLLVMGDFYTDSEVSHSGWLDNGIMEVKGDFTQYTTKNMPNFLSTRNFHLYLTGTEAQKLEISQRFYQGDCIANLVIENESEQGITMVNNPCITGSITTNDAVIDGSISIGPETVFEEDYFDGGIRLSHAGLAGRITQELTIGKDLTLEKSGGKLNIEKQLTVKGDAWIGNEVYPIGGRLIVEGDMTVDDGGDGHSCGIYMIEDNAYVLVEGDYTHKTQKGVPMPGGILEIKGNVTLGSAFVTEESHKMILSGEEAQYVSAEKGAVLNILELQNHSDAGVILRENVAWKKLVKNGCKVTMGGNSGYTGYTLEEDETFEEEFVLTGGTLDLNGHTMTIKGDFIHSGGTVLINGGQLIIERDYRIQERSRASDGSYEYGESGGTLKMQGKEDYVLVGGTFYYYPGAQGGLALSAGCLELKGDFYQCEEASPYSFMATDSHTLLISGDKKQTIHFRNDEDCYNFSYIQNLNITNRSSEGVVIEGTPWVRGRCESARESSVEGLVYKDGTNCYDWGEYYAGDLGTIFTLNLYNDFELGGDLYVHNLFNLYGDLTVDGNIYMSDYSRWKYNGYIYLKGGNLVVKGDVEAGSKYYYSGIRTQSNNAYVLIEGNYRILECGEGHQLSFSAGVLEVKGDIDFKGKVSHDGQLILSGDKKQTVRVGAGTDINQLKIENTSEEGICLESYIKVKSWEGGDCPITFKGEACILGYSLTKDITIDGNVVLLGGVMALNGYRLQINGNLTQMGGDIRVNTGSLYINGDYYLGNPKEALVSYDMETFGMLYMDYEKDYVCVEGDFYESKSSGAWIDLKAGTLELHGNMDYEKSLYSYGNHTLLLKGDRQQKITFHGTDTNKGSGLKNLTLDNQSEEGIVFVNNPYFTGTISDREENRVSGAVEIQSMGQLENGYFGGSIYYRTNGLGTDEDIHIGGDLKIQYSAPTTISGQLQVDGNLDLDGILNMSHGSLLVGGDLNIRKNSSNYVNNGINMSHDDDYVLVEGSFTNESGKPQSMNGGVLEVKGDYREQKEIFYTGTHRIIFSGEERQVVEQQGKFHILELRNESQEGVFSENAL